VPKAAVNEDGKSVRGKNKIRFARKIQVPAPSRNPGVAEKL
jgi:hypothetical protein